jgi:hypothetical protein
METTNLIVTAATNNSSQAVQMSAQYVWQLSLLASGGLIILWAIFWLVVWRRQESATEIVAKPEFFQIITVMGIVSATVVLSLAGRIDGNLTAAILSGIAGFVLGSVSQKPKDPPKPAAGTPQLPVV